MAPGVPEEARPSVPTAQEPAAKLVVDSLERVLGYSKRNGYAGYSKFDALNSPWVEVLLGWNSIPRLLITQLVNRSYVPLRPLLRVRKSRNPKGIANFVKAYCNLYQLRGQPEHLAEARLLADWLLENHSNRGGTYAGLCWGYNFPWQSPGFFAPRFSPNCIVTVFCADAMLHVYRATGDTKYLDACRSVAEFVVRDLPVLEETEESKCIAYVPHGARWKVININAVAAGFLASVAAVGEPDLLGEARKLVQWVVDQRTPYYGWYYTVPRGSSGIGHDNYHTGGILDGIRDYITYSGDTTHEEVYLKGLEFYRQNLFTPAGAPRLMSDREYPYDIHGTAQGILSFAKASGYEGSNLDFALKLAVWGIRNMQDPTDGHFYYRKHRLFTRKECEMRWNNSWMSWALSALLPGLSGEVNV